MKRTLPLLLLMMISTALVQGQIVTPIVKANFGIEADLTCNFYNGAAQPAVDDWYGNAYPGTGQFMIDTTGAAAIVSGYTSNPISRTWSFSRLMKPTAYSLVNNRLVLDAVFHRDFHGDDSTVFASGSNKNGMSPAAWTCPVSQGIPDKNDILDAFVHVRRAGPNATDSLWMFGALSIENTTGSRYFDFELYQTDIAYNRATRTFSGYGPDAGHTTWKFDAGGNIVTPGDIVFTAEFGSSTLTLVQARIWVDKTSLLTTPTAFSWGGQFDGAAAGAQYGYASIVPKTAGAFYTGLQNTTAGTWAGPFSLVRDNNNVLTTYIANQFMEFSVNLTKLGIEPANFSNNACGSPFRRVLIKTRASTSFTAELKDFIAPFKMFDYPMVDADAFIRYYCKVMPTITISVYNPLPTSIYTWSTNNGHIVGSNVGPSIQVNAPGMYYVTQQLHAQCPRFATDSVKIIFDSVCQVLPLDFTRFNAFKRRVGAELRWQVTNNENAAGYDMEYSLDNEHYIPFAFIPSNGRAGIAEYSVEDPLHGSEPLVYYRVRATGHNGVTKYSEISSLRSNRMQTNNALIFPNPVNNVAWLSMEMSEKTEATILIMDSYGRLVSTASKQLKKGSNMIYFDQLAKLPKGVYLVKIRSGNSENTQKVIVL